MAWSYPFVVHMTCPLLWECDALESGGSYKFRSHAHVSRMAFQLVSRVVGIASLVQRIKTSGCCQFYNLHCSGGLKLHARHVKISISHCTIQWIQQRKLQPHWHLMMKLHPWFENLCQLNTITIVLLYSDVYWYMHSWLPYIRLSLQHFNKTKIYPKSSVWVKVLSIFVTRHNLHVMLLFHVAIHIAFRSKHMIQWNDMLLHQYNGY